jgi:RNA methyltransferase, TrmH family
MRTERITSTSNPRIVEARKLSQKKHRCRQGRFAAEGLQILRMACEAIAARGTSHVKPLDVFYCEDLFTSAAASAVLAQLTAAGGEAIPVTPQVLETLSSRILSQGLVSTFAADPLAASLHDLSDGSAQTPRLVVVLDRPQYPGNVGTLIRTAHAVGATGVILIEPAADAFDPHAIRASMGSIFSVPVVRAEAIGPLRAWAADTEVRWVIADAAHGEPIWTSDALHGSVGLILGNEGSGPQPELHAMAHSQVCLPQPGGTDSLNVAVAGGILMYEWLRVNGAGASSPHSDASGAPH